MAENKKKRSENGAQGQKVPAPFPTIKKYIQQLKNHHADLRNPNNRAIIVAKDIEEKRQEITEIAENLYKLREQPAMRDYKDMFSRWCGIIQDICDDLTLAAENSDANKHECLRYLRNTLKPLEGLIDDFEDHYEKAKTKNM